LFQQRPYPAPGSVLRANAGGNAPGQSSAPGPSITSNELPTGVYGPADPAESALVAKKRAAFAAKVGQPSAAQCLAPVLTPAPLASQARVIDRRM
jgi:hypothetical protein